MENIVVAVLFGVNYRLMPFRRDANAVTLNDAVCRQLPIQMVLYAKTMLCFATEQRAAVTSVIIPPKIDEKFR